MQQVKSATDMGRILGIDYGDKRIGLAISDTTKMLARPFQVVSMSPDFPELLKKLMAAEEVEQVILGWPIHMDGSVGAKARQVLQFKETIERHCGIVVELWDERLTTVQAESLLREAGISSRKRDGKVDSAAAQVLLQSYLDHLGRKERECRVPEE
jgi:putative Holliday junction resolvase